MRRRVEEMLVEGHRDGHVISMLESLVGEADEGSETALFAHRQLAELRLEESPWHAALHLRRLLTAEAADDGVHALLGLCHALMGHFRTAVASYRRALRIAPNNPWYHHNVGHLLDVGLARPQAAVSHLRRAHEIEPEEDEVSASLAHCLARLGDLREAERLARLSLLRAPQHREHRDMLRWIEEGAPEGKSAPSARGPLAGPAGGQRRGAPESEPPRLAAAAVHGGPVREEPSDAVASLLVARMPSSGCSDRELDRARAVWRDFREACRPRVVKPEVFAAAVEYAVAKLSGASGVTQAALAARYGVGSRSVSQRYAEIRDGLGLVPDDPRY